MGRYGNRFPQAEGFQIQPFHISLSLLLAESIYLAYIYAYWYVFRESFIYPQKKFTFFFVKGDGIFLKLNHNG